MQLSEKLVKLRKTKGMSQLKLAEMMNVSRQAVSRWEVGAAVPSIDNLKYLGGLYEVPLEYLLHDDAPDPVRVDLEPVGETAENAVKEKSGNILLVLIAIGVAIVILCAMHFGNRSEDTVQMNYIEGSEMETVNDFDLDW